MHGATIQKILMLLLRYSYCFLSAG